ncbi:Zinc finger SWIM domain-containing protein 8 [Cichlidogyrus casuarinus]|uniref:Zinc finger SWIM domain-containing protein 8 n=1 Tax=Cichlidogyrus casuarinus TaxID=1844966 RepID=A0ABD2PUI3_9PLAT
MLLGRSAVDAYCMLILKCVQCPLMMTEICNKAVGYFRSQMPPSFPQAYAYSAQTYPTVQVAGHQFPTTQAYPGIYHRLFEQRMRFIGSSQAEWDELVDLVLKAHSLYVVMPSTDRSLTFNNLLHRINKHPKCSKDLWDRIYAGLQTLDLKS